MLTFLSPLFLLGLLSAAIPLLIHLSRSRRTKTLRFSTTRFFTEQFLRTYRMSRIQQRLLLACRMALCALLALALARPLWRPSGLPLVPVGSRAVVIVLDDSASMGYVEAGRSLIDRAKAAAREVISGLRPGDTAALVLAGRRAEGPLALFPVPTPDLNDVLQAIDAAKAESLSTDLAGALNLARRIAQSSRSAGREIVLFSDLQATGWTSSPSVDPSSEAIVQVVRVRPDRPANLAVTAIQHDAARPAAGVPFAIRPRIVAQGDAPPSADVRLVVDGRQVAERRIERLGDGRWAVPRFHVAFDTPGWHSGHVEIADAHLAADNRRAFAVEVLGAPDVLAVDGAPSRIARNDELFFLRAALSAGGKGAVQLRAIEPAALAGHDLTRTDVVILANVAAPSASAVEALETHVDRGGSLLVFLGDRVDPSAYNAAFTGPAHRHGGLLPGPLHGREGDPSSPGDLAVGADVVRDHPALAWLDDESTLTSVRFKALGTVEAPAESVLMRTTTGSPLLCEKRFGRGRVLLFASTCDRDWTDFPVRPAYLPWLHRLIAYLAQSPDARAPAHLTGSVVPVILPAADEVPRVTVERPDGSKGTLAASPDPAHPLVLDDTAQSGIYRLVTEGSPEPFALLAVNLEGYESDLTPLDERMNAARAEDRGAIEAALRDRILGRPPVAYINDPDRVGESSPTARGGVRLWDAALWSALLLGLFEPWFANRINLRAAARPRDPARQGTAP